MHESNILNDKSAIATDADMFSSGPMPISLFNDFICFAKTAVMLPPQLDSMALQN